MQQLYRAMRETGPGVGMFDGGSAEGMFTGMHDEHIAAIAAARRRDGPGEALCRQLATRPGPPSGGPVEGSGT